MRSKLTKQIYYCPIALLTFAAHAVAQAASSAPDESESSGLFYSLLMFALAAGAFGIAYYFWKKSQKSIEPKYNYEGHKKELDSSGAYDLEGLDADKELEWLRKAKKTTDPQNGRKPTAVESPIRPTTSAKPAAEDLDTKSFQEKMRRLQYNQLPINSFFQLAPARLYDPLPVSNNEGLLDAIEQTYVEDEDDEAVREVALRILTAFRTRNSVEALSQLALYDLSAPIRSKAVTTLTDFDHESVFETILLACADPTREVRAAAARGLFRLNFDRAHAWKRLIETNDEFRMSHAARAATEAGIVIKSFDRLIHEDHKIAYEAFCLVMLLIRSGEIDGIFDTIREHKDERVKFALLHVLKVAKDPRTLDRLNKLRASNSISTSVADKVREAVESFEMAVA